MSKTNAIRLKAIQTLRNELRQRNKIENSRSLETELEKLQQKHGTSNLFVSRAFRLIRRYPIAKQRFDEILEDVQKDSPSDGGEERNYNPFGGKMVNPPSDGIKMVCPIITCRNNMEVFSVAERAFCSRHGKKMIRWSEKYGG